MTDITAAAIPTSSSPPPASAQPDGTKVWSGLSFSGVLKDLLDIVNPLQHLPIVGSIYRYLTGDEPTGGARIAGDTLYGGPIGLAVGVVSTMLLDKHGHDLGERTLAAVFGPSDHSSATAVASASADTTTAAAQPAPVVPMAASQAVPLQTGSALPANPPLNMNDLFRSAPPQAAAAPSPSPEQTFLSQNAQFQRQFTGNRPSTGPTLNNRPVPLELSSNLLPLPRATTVLVPATRPPATLPLAAGRTTPDPASGPNPIAQKMIDALDKYEQMKKKQNQGDSGSSATPAKVDLSL